MRSLPSLALIALLVQPVLLAQLAGAAAQQTAPAPGEAEPLLTGAAAMGDWTADRPGLRRKLSVADLPPPYATPSAGNSPSVVRAPRGAQLRVPQGFSVDILLTGLSGPRLMRRAPNGDIFLAESEGDRIRVIRPTDGAARPDRVEIFAKDLLAPFGIAFYPPGPDPQWVYVATTESVLRYPYAAGDLVARGRPELVVNLPISEGGHWTRDIVFSPDGKRMYVSVGSQSNVASEMGPLSKAEQARFEAAHAPGATWGDEENRADVLVFDPKGTKLGVFATGLRNCVGLALHPESGDLWCSTNERDGLGDNLPPDYVTRVREGGFYGWPWYYLGANEDPRHKGERPDLAGKVIVPDVLLQAHSAPLAMTFYEPGQAGPAAFPKDYEGDAFVALHGSWNRARRTGYKVVRLKLDHGVPSGEYQDFLTGFVIDRAKVWGRPVGVVVAHDGALIVSEDGNGTLWRVAPR